MPVASGDSSSGASGGVTPGPDAAVGGTVGSNDPPPMTPDAAATVETPVDAAATIDPPQAIDAGVTLVAGIKVQIWLKNGVAFEAYENGVKLFDGPDTIEIVPGVPRTITLKAKGFKDKAFSVDGKTKKLMLKLDRIPGVVVPIGPGSGSGSAVVTPPKLDCSNQIKEPRNKGCVAQYCAKHASDPICDIE